MEPLAEQLARQLELSRAKRTDEENRLVELAIQVKPEIVDLARLFFWRLPKRRKARPRHSETSS